jgi:hypothetical protein
MTKFFHSGKIRYFFLWGLLMAGVNSLAVPSFAGLLLSLSALGQRDAPNFSSWVSFLTLLAVTVFVYFSTPSVMGVCLLGLSLDRLSASHHFTKSTGLWIGLAIGGLVAGMGSVTFLVGSPSAKLPASSLWTILAPIAVVEMISYGCLGWYFASQGPLRDAAVEDYGFRRRAILRAGLASCLVLSGALILGRFQAARVEAAVRTALDYCAEPDAKMLVYPSGFLGFMVAYPSLMWSINCVPLPPEPPIVGVNVLTCELSVTTFVGSRSQKMPHCP